MENKNSQTEHEITFELIEEIGIISEGTNGWNKELNLVRWNNGSIKYDIRDWKDDHTAMSRGITLHEDEATTLAQLLSERFASKQGKGKKECA